MLPDVITKFFPRHTTSSDSDVERPRDLREVLDGWQIFFISISTVVGVTIFYRDGEALAIAGPSGAFVAFGVMGAVAISVMECVSELIQMFPTPNAIVEFVRIFVDEDLAWVIGVGYWYAFSAIFATQIIAAAAFTSYWDFPQVYQSIFLYFITPIILLIINFSGVFWFGWIETVGGILKICVVVGGALFMYVLNGQRDVKSDYISQGFRNDPAVAGSPSIAGCYVIPIIAYGFLGVEMISVTAFEARDLQSLRRPSQIIAWFVLVLYFFCAIGEMLNVEWTNEALPAHSSDGRVNAEHTTEDGRRLQSRAVIVIAALDAGYTSVAGLLNGCMIFSALSASNTSLYVASRILYGMSRKIDRHSRFSIFRGLGDVWLKTGVPMRALGVSFIAFIWFPFLSLRQDIGVSDLLDIMGVSSSVSCLLAWAAVCTAFLRYWLWFKKHEDYVKDAYPEHNRLSRQSQSSTMLEAWQPIPALVGLLGSMLIVFVFTTATWWDKPVNFRKVAIAYGAPVVLTTFFVISKAFTRRMPVELSNDRAVFQRAIEELKQPKDAQIHRRRANASTALSVQLNEPSTLDVEKEEAAPAESQQLAFFKAAPPNGQSSGSGTEISG